MPVIGISLLSSCHADSSSDTCQSPSVPAEQCHNATYHCIPVHINATNQCPSELPFSVTHQCQSVPP
ncbi:unnamed protein product, partial [Staurois parvus]